MNIQKKIERQLARTRQNLEPDALVLDGLISMQELMELFFIYLEGQMDKKMHKVTEKIKVAEKDIKKGKIKKASKVLKVAAKKNEKLVKLDKKVRDPEIKAYKKVKKEMC